MARIDNGRLALEHYGHIIWDWNGTLLDDIALCVEVNSAIMVDHGLPELSVDRYQALFGFPIEDYYQRLGFDFAKTPFADLADRYIVDYNARARDMPLHKGALEALKYIAGLGKKQSLLSAAQQDHVEEMLGHFGLSEHFHHIYGVTGRYAASKIERGRQLIVEAGVAPEETLLIGDTDHDHEVAEDLGIDVLLVASGHQSYERLKDRHHAVVERLEGVFG
ncbi:MAG: HAD hydrolase-like protein [Proteobacteria bacterium]|nr:HAD hydrolase-like protein [Pseudomonadota bacterium]